MQSLSQMIITLLILVSCCKYQQSMVSFALAATASSKSSSVSSSIDIPRLQSTIAKGRVYQHENFINETQVLAILNDIERLKEEQIMKPSGLSNTLKKENQNFGQEDRTTAPAPWWMDSLQQQQQVKNECNSDNVENPTCQNINNNDNEPYNSPILQSVIDKIQSLRTDVSTTLHRPSMNDPTLAHECYYSQSKPGAFLPRHMDERHEELKGPRGWMLPSRRSISWLIYLSDVDLVGGDLRTFPQSKFETVGSFGSIESGCHDGNLQIGWIDVSSSSLSLSSSPSLSSSAENDGDVKTFPVYLDSWYTPKKNQGVTNDDNDSNDEAAIPLCILYTVSDTTNEIIYITKPWSNDSITMSTTDFLKDQAAKKKEVDGQNSLFMNHIYAKNFRLLEDREAWSLSGNNGDGNVPLGSESIDIIPKRGSLVMFDSVTLPHEVLVVERNTRSALAGWFHEQTQEFPMTF